MAAHRYWRVLILRATDTSFIGAAEIELRSSVGGSDITGSGTASAYSYYGGGYEASKAFDNNTATGWASATPVVGQDWIKYDFGSGTEVGVAEIAWTSRDTNINGPTTFFLQYSDDDSAWHTEISFFNQPLFTAYLQQKVYNASSTGAVVGDLFPLRMTSASAPSPFVISADSEYSGTYAAWKACDYDYGTYWVNSASTTGFLKIDLGSGNEQTVTSVGYQNNTVPNPTRMPQDFTIQGSNNDSDWTTLETVTGETAWGDNEHRVFALTTTGSYRYYKIDITANNGASDLACGGFYLFAEEAPVTSTGTLGATESGSDIAAVTGLTIHSTGTIDATETGSDAAYFTDEATSVGTLAATETGSDVAAATGGVLVEGTLAKAETGSDTAAMTGSALGAHADLVIELPAIAVAIEARGVNCELVIDLPVIEFFGETSAPAWLDFTLPAMEVLFGAAFSLDLEIPFQEFAFTAVSGATCSLDLDLPALVFDAQTGAALAFDLAVIEAALTGTTGLAADLHLNFPALEVLLEGTVGQLAQLQISLPAIIASFTASQQTLSSLLLEFPPLQVLLSGSVGSVGSIVFDLPVPEILMTSYEDISASLVFSLPVPKFYLEGAAMARFDNYILSYTRPS